MHIAGTPKAVVLGITTKMPYAGMVLIAAQYLVGLRRLGFDVYYVEEHGKMPWMLMDGAECDGSVVAGQFIDDMMGTFGLDHDHWAFRSFEDARQCRGLSSSTLEGIYRDAAIILNLHGGTPPRPEHAARGRLVYVGTDPVEHEVALHNGDQGIVDYLAPHCAFFTWGANYGNPDCGVPPTDRFPFIPSRQPIVMDLWPASADAAADTFTTIGNWRQPYRTITFNGEVYYWSKHIEFMKFIDLPRRCEQPFELALTNLEDDDRRMLESHGWKTRDAKFTLDLDAYRAYVGASRGEFTVAKDQNVRLRSGWFSDRSASFLASGRPVVTQETGFSNVLPTGEGLFGFSSIEQIEDAISRINSDYARHSRAAKRIAREWFDYRIVLGAMLEHLDCVPANVR
jgi:hypothetical protein